MGAESGGGQSAEERLRSPVPPPGRCPPACLPSVSGTGGVPDEPGGKLTAWPLPLSPLLPPLKLWALATEAMAFCWPEDLSLVLLLFSCCSLSVFLLLLLLSLSPFLCWSEQRELKGRKRGERRGGGGALVRRRRGNRSLSLSLSVSSPVGPRTKSSFLWPPPFPTTARRARQATAQKAKVPFLSLAAWATPTPQGGGAETRTRKERGKERHKKREKIVSWQVSREKKYTFYNAVLSRET